MPDLAALGGPSWRACRAWRRGLLRGGARWWGRPLASIVEPLLYLLAFGVVLGPIVGEVTHDGTRTAYPAFVAPGLLALSVALHAFRESLDGARSRLRTGTPVEALLATPLSVGDVVAGEILCGATLSLLAGGAALAAIGLAGAAEWPSSWWSLPVAALEGLLFASAGVCLAAVASGPGALRLAIALVALPMFLFSGTFFPVDSMPGWAARLAEASPLTHAASLARAALLGRPPAHLVASVAYLGVTTLALFSAALALTRRRLVR